MPRGGPRAHALEDFVCAHIHRRNRDGGNPGMRTKAAGGERLANEGRASHVEASRSASAGAMAHGDANAKLLTCPLIKCLS